MITQRSTSSCNDSSDITMDTACRVDSDRPCEVLTPILTCAQYIIDDSSEAGLEEVQNVLIKALPCRRGECRKALAIIDDLGGTRLGSRRRQLIRNAPTPSEERSAPPYGTNSRAERKAIGRAGRALKTAGLLEWNGRLSPPGIRRTPIGQRLVDIAGDPLKAGKRVRWKELQPKLREGWPRSLNRRLEDVKSHLESIIECRQRRAMLSRRLRATNKVAAAKLAIKATEMALETTGTAFSGGNK